jgi:hypothetical protein
MTQAISSRVFSDQNKKLSPGQTASKDNGQQEKAAACQPAAAGAPGHAGLEAKGSSLLFLP